MPDSFWNFVNKGDGCWIWTGPQFAGGYGGLYLHHLCHNKLCVRPIHLSPLSRKAHWRAHFKTHDDSRYIGGIDYGDTQE